MNSKTKRIAELNDQCRKLETSCKVFMTPGIGSLSLADQAMIAQKVQDFDDFTADNDPYGERDFGAFTHNGQKIFWKIDYYALDMQHGSEDPSDPEQTIRVLTIMLAEEY